MNFWVIISYLKVKNLSRNVAPEKCKKTAQITPSKVSPGRQKQQKQQLQNNKTKKQQITQSGDYGDYSTYCL